MALYRDALPQLSGDLFLMDAGLETDIIFNHGVDIPEFAAHTLLPDPKGREVLATYLRGFLGLANTTGAGLILDSQTWKAHMHWAKDLGASEEDLRQATHDSVAFISDLRNEFSANEKPILLSGLIGPRGDAYAPEEAVAADEAERYQPSKSVGWRKPMSIWSPHVKFGPPALGVRRGKAAFFSGYKSHPATIAPAGSNRSGHGGDEMAEAFG